MPVAALAPVIGGAISAGAGLLGSSMQSNAISQGQDKAIAAQQAALAQQRSDLAPWVATGQPANTATADLLGLNGQDAANAAMANYQTSPGYQWQLDQGLRAVDAGAAAKGMERSGATLKAEQTFGQGLADSDFQNYYNNLFSLSKLGQTSAAGQGAGEITTGQGIASTDIGAAGAQASIYGNAAKGLSTALTGGSTYTPGVGTTTTPGLFGSLNSLFGGGNAVSPTTVSNNALYQQGAFAAQPAGTFGPFA